MMSAFIKCLTPKREIFAQATRPFRDFRSSLRCASSSSEKRTPGLVGVSNEKITVRSSVVSK